MSDLVKDIRATIGGGGYRLYVRGGKTFIALDPDLVCTTPALGGNAASGLLNNLRAAGFHAEPPDWEHLLAGEECVVVRVAYTTAALVDRLYGPKPDATESQQRSRRSSAAAWARRKGVEPTNPGFAPLMWPVGPVDVALAERAAMHAAGLVTPGNRTRGPVRSAAVGRSWVRRRAGDQGGVTRVDDPT